MTEKKNNGFDSEKNINSLFFVVRIGFLDRFVKVVKKIHNVKILKVFPTSFPLLFLL